MCKRMHQRAVVSIVVIVTIIAVVALFVARMHQKDDNSRGRVRLLEANGCYPGKATLVTVLNGAVDTINSLLRNAGLTNKEVTYNLPYDTYPIASYTFPETALLCKGIAVSLSAVSTELKPVGITAFADLQIEGAPFSAQNANIVGTGGGSYSCLRMNVSSSTGQGIRCSIGSLTISCPLEITFSTPKLGPWKPAKTCTFPVDVVLEWKNAEITLEYAVDIDLINRDEGAKFPEVFIPSLAFSKLLPVIGSDDMKRGSGTGLQLTVSDDINCTSKNEDACTAASKTCAWHDPNPLKCIISDPAKCKAASTTCTWDGKKCTAIGYCDSPCPGPICVGIGLPVANWIIQLVLKLFDDQPAGWLSIVNALFAGHDFQKSVLAAVNGILARESSVPQCTDTSCRLPRSIAPPQIPLWTAGTTGGWPRTSKVSLGQLNEVAACAKGSVAMACNGPCASTCTEDGVSYGCGCVPVTSSDCDVLKDLLTSFLEVNTKVLSDLIASEGYTLNETISDQINKVEELKNLDIFISDSVGCGWTDGKAWNDWVDGIDKRCTTCNGVWGHLSGYITTPEHPIVLAGFETSSLSNIKVLDIQVVSCDPLQLSFTAEADLSVPKINSHTPPWLAFGKDASECKIGCPQSENENCSNGSCVDPPISCTPGSCPAGFFCCNDLFGMHNRFKNPDNPDTTPRTYCVECENRIFGDSCNTLVSDHYETCKNVNMCAHYVDGSDQLIDGPVNLTIEACSQLAGAAGLCVGRGSAWGTVPKGKTAMRQAGFGTSNQSPDNPLSTYGKADDCPNDWKPNAKFRFTHSFANCMPAAAGASDCDPFWGPQCPVDYACTGTKMVGTPPVPQSICEPSTCDPKCSLQSNFFQTYICDETNKTCILADGHHSSGAPIMKDCQYPNLVVERSPACMIDPAFTMYANVELTASINASVVFTGTLSLPATCDPFKDPSSCVPCICVKNLGLKAPVIAPGVTCPTGKKVCGKDMFGITYLNIFPTDAGSSIVDWFWEKIEWVAKVNLSAKIQPIISEGVMGVLGIASPVGTTAAAKASGASSGAFDVATQTITVASTVVFVVGGSVLIKAPGGGCHPVPSDDPLQLEGHVVGLSPTGVLAIITSIVDATHMKINLNIDVTNTQVVILNRWPENEYTFKQGIAGLEKIINRELTELLSATGCDDC